MGPRRGAVDHAHRLGDHRGAQVVHDRGVEAGRQPVTHSAFTLYTECRLYVRTVDERPRCDITSKNFLSRSGTGCTTGWVHRHPAEPSTDARRYEERPMSLTVAVAQFAPCEDKRANLDTMIGLLRQAAGRGA